MRKHTINNPQELITLRKLNVTKEIDNSINYLTEVTSRSLVFGVDADGGVGFRAVVVLVAPAPQVVRPVARAVHSLLDDLLRHRLQIVRPAELSEEVDEVSREVQPVVS